MDGTLLAALGGTAALARMAAWGAVLAGGLLLVWLWRGTRARAVAEERARELDLRLAEMARLQAEMTGRMQTMAEIFGNRTSDLARFMSERLDSQGQRMGRALEENAQRTGDTLTQLAERLAVIDRAQSNITQLSSEVVSLQQILANKQTRGAFGQGRMEAILTDGLPINGFTFQATLSNGRRPDALVHMPNGAPSLVIDAKFPLESWQRLKSAATPEELKLAQSGFRADMQVHIRAIAENYLLPDETADTALMFVPSESIFAELHEHFDDVVQRAIKARVVVVSPSILMLSVQVVQALLRDVRMREEAHRIQREVREFLVDLGRLDERVRKLQTHFTQAASDIGDIVTSSGKLTRRGERISAMEFDEQPVAPRLAGE